MRELTLLLLKSRLNEIITSGITISEYCTKNDISNNYFSNKKEKLMNDALNGSELAKECIRLYNSIKGVSKIESEQIKSVERIVKEVFSEEKEDKIIEISKTESVVDDNYYFNIKKKSGFLTESEMDLLCRTYVKTGLNQTKSQLTKIFIDYTEVELGQILRYFKITKDSLPFSPKLIEEKTPEELVELEISRKNKMVKAQVEQEKTKQLEKSYNSLLNKIVSTEYIEESIVRLYENLDLTNLPKYKPINALKRSPDNDSLMLHFSDFHIGAKVSDHSLYLNDWNEEELYRRATYVLDGIKNYGKFNTIIINILGDMLDGQNGFTTRGGHPLPQNMDNDQQIETYTKFMMWFVNQLRDNDLCNELKIYSVKSGNHDGVMGQLATQVLLTSLKIIHGDFISDIELFKDQLGTYEFKGRRFIIFHGKDDKFMKRPWPLNMDKPTQLFIESWLRTKRYLNDDIHIIKGDLHQEALSVTEIFTYRNVPSIFGSSDHSQMNYTPTRTGVAYELFLGTSMVRGTFLTPTE